MTNTEIKDALTALGINKREAAMMLGYSHQARISEVLAGRVTPSASVIRLLRAYLDGYRPADWPAP